MVMLLFSQRKTQSIAQAQKGNHEDTSSVHKLYIFVVVLMSIQEQVVSFVSVRSRLVHTQGCKVSVLYDGRETS